MGGIHQKADFFWGSDGGTWIADAKYKHLARGSQDSLGFRDIQPVEGDENREPPGPRAGQVLSPDDVRPLTVYAELCRTRAANANPPRLMLIYPFMGREEFAADHAEAWNVPRCGL